MLTLLSGGGRVRSSEIRIIACRRVRRKRTTERPRRRRLWFHDCLPSTQTSHELVHGYSIYEPFNVDRDKLNFRARNDLAPLGWPQGYQLHRGNSVNGSIDIFGEPVDVRRYRVIARGCGTGRWGESDDYLAFVSGKPLCADVGLRLGCAH